MSELINTKNGCKDLRWQLLITVSALALIGNVYSAQNAKADGDADRPTLWIELGGQFEHQTNQGDGFLPPFVVNNADSAAFSPASPLQAQKTPSFSDGFEGKVTFEPTDTDWVFSGAFRFGRSIAHRRFSQTNIITNVVTTSAALPDGIRSYGRSGTPRYRDIVKKQIHNRHASLYAGSQVSQGQSHTILDFAVGKDYGVGMFGRNSQSDFNIGVRFAQFASKVAGVINARPKVGEHAGCVQFTPSQLPYFTTGATRVCQVAQDQHTYAGSFESRRSFHGIGPALSWNASVPIFGEQPFGSLNVDWGGNAAVLFGRQRATGDHRTSAYYHENIFYGGPHIAPTHHTSAGGFSRTRAVVVPNVGGFAGVSFHFTRAKIALGYRGDFFFGAMDTGNDVRATKTVGFYGPFATISIGIGG